MDDAKHRNRITKLSPTEDDMDLAVELLELRELHRIDRAENGGDG